MEKCFFNHKWLCLGNHDSKSIKWYLEHGWDFVCESFTLDMFAHKILFSHKPLSGNYTINIHGHLHNSDHRTKEEDIKNVLNKNQYLVALEYTNYQPVTLDSIIRKFEKGMRHD